MGTSALKLRYLVICIFVVCGQIHTSGGISIEDREEPVVVSVNDTVITLPCDFRLASYETPQITWYHEKHGERRKIMEYDINNRLSSYGEFVNRVARGDRGALVLLRPRPSDSGNYVCEVEVDNEVPSFAKTTVTLTVRGKAQANETGPTDMPTEKDNTGLLVLIAFFCILMMTSSFLLGGKKIVTCQGTREKPRKKTPGQLLTLAPRLVVVVVLVVSLVFFFTAIICTAVALSSAVPETSDHYRLVGLATGIIGMLLVIVAVVWIWVRPKLSKKNAPDQISKNPDDVEAGNTDLNQSTISIEETFHDANADPSGFAESRPAESKSLLPQAAVAKVTKREPEIKALHVPEGEIVTGITAMSYKDVYLTTVNGVYKLDLTEGSKPKIHTPLFQLKENLIAITKYKNDLLITAIKRKAKVDKSRLLRVKLSETKSDKIPLESQSTLTWTVTSRDEKWLYLTMTNPAMVVKRSMEKKKVQTFGEGVMKNPTCIVQNSSGQLVVADSHKHDLLVFKEDGDFVTSMKISVPRTMEDEMKACNKLAVGSDDRIYATSQTSKNILVFSSDFRFERLLPTRAEGSSSISSLMVHNDSLYVAHEDCIRVHSLNSDT